MIILVSSQVQCMNVFVINHRWLHSGRGSRSLDRPQRGREEKGTLLVSWTEYQPRSATTPATLSTLSTPSDRSLHHLWMQVDIHQHRSFGATVTGQPPPPFCARVTYWPGIWMCNKERAALYRFSFAVWHLKPVGYRYFRPERVVWVTTGISPAD